MYLIRLPSGREASFETLQELVGAIQRGDVQRDAVIFHHRTNQWLPIERHPHFQDSSLGAAADPPPEPVAPTPLAGPAAARLETRAPLPAAAAPPGREPHASPLGQAPPRRSRTALAAAAIIVLGGVSGVAIGWKLRPGEVGDGKSFFYRPAPAPSSLLRPDPAPLPSAERRAATPPPPRPDPLAPVTATDLADRRSAAFAAARTQLSEEIAAVGLPQVFGLRSLATPEGARAGRRIVAAALNVVGQFHRREIMLDQAYRDTAAFQTTRAGWSAEERRGWDERSALREPYSAADLAESLLADADSLLAILAGNRFTVRGDSLDFGDASVAASYRAQRARIQERSGSPVGDPDRRPTLANVQRSIDPARLPEGAP